MSESGEGRKPKFRILGVREGHEVHSGSSDIHPFDEPYFIDFIEREFPQFTDSIKSANRPRVSNAPDDMERWEATQILERKGRFPFESDFAYLSRLLYEETFSVNQHPGVPNPPMYRGVAGFTPGGLISHFYYGGSSGKDSVKSVVARHPKGETLKEATSSLKDKRKREALLRVAAQCTYGDATTSGRYGGISLRVPTIDTILRWADKPQEAHFPEDMDTIGYRLIQMLAAAPNMLNQVQDEKLKQLFGAKSAAPITLSVLLMLVWDKFSSRLLTSEGFFKDESAPGVKEALSELLFFRTHPETQILYQYFSPSGYINNTKVTDKRGAQI